MIFVSLFKGRGKLIKLLEVKCETERKSGQVRYALTAEILIKFVYTDTVTVPPTTRSRYLTYRMPVQFQCLVNQ